MSVNLGKLHEYLGMNLDYSEEGSVKLYMIKYTVKILRAFTENIVGSVASPAAEHLFRSETRKIPNTSCKSRIKVFITQQNS